MSDCSGCDFLFHLYIGILYTAIYSTCGSYINNPTRSNDHKIQISHYENCRINMCQCLSLINVLTFTQAWMISDSAPCTPYLSSYKKNSTITTLTNIKNDANHLLVQWHRRLSGLHRDLEIPSSSPTVCGFV